MTIRALAFVSIATLALIGCSGGGDQENNTVNIDQAVMSDDLAANDVTAIDAVTGDAANMAADVDINFTNEMLAQSGGNGSSSESPRPRSRGSSPRPATGNTTAPAPEPAANTTNAGSNATE